LRAAFSTSTTSLGSGRSVRLLGLDSGLDLGVPGRIVCPIVMRFSTMRIDLGANSLSPATNRLVRQIDVTPLQPGYLTATQLLERQRPQMPVASHGRECGTSRRR
jgi:hypothetical protein